MCLYLQVIGDSCVGRTWLIHRFVHKEDVRFPDMPTIGVDYDIVSIKGRDCNTYKLYIWELSAPFFEILRFLSRTSGILLLFDITNEETFHNAIGKWMDHISSHAPADVPIILVGTKCDLNEERVISQDRIHTVCDEMNLLYIEVSAKEGINVDFAFTEILEEMIPFEKLKSTRYSREIRNLPETVL